MLAYLFWHWHSADVEKTIYQKRLIDFHEVLRAQQPQGFHYSKVFQIERAPWLNRNEETYEEWYVVENFAALEVLNETAVNGPCKEPHHLVAKDAAGGVGAVYRPWAGEPDLATAQVALWFAKTVGTSYERLSGMLQPEIKSVAGSVWQRQMVLGPAPEFCWHSAQDHRLPEIFEHVIQINISRLY